MKYLLLAILFVGCSNTETGPAPSPMPMPAKKAQHIWPNSQLDDYAREAIQLYGKELLQVKPADADTWCLDWANTDKVSFYSALLSHMSKYESNFKTELQYKEKFKDGTGEFVISRGLLQVSRESCQVVYKTPLAKAEDLHKPQKNLECSVRILNKLIVQDNLISAIVDSKYKGTARYWSVMRPENKLGQIKVGVLTSCK